MPKLFISSFDVFSEEMKKEVVHRNHSNTAKKENPYLNLEKEGSFGKSTGSQFFSTNSKSWNQNNIFSLLFKLISDCFERKYEAKY